MQKLALIADYTDHRTLAKYTAAAIVLSQVNINMGNQLIHDRDKGKNVEIVNPASYTFAVYANEKALNEGCAIVTQFSLSNVPFSSNSSTTSLEKMALDALKAKRYDGQESTIKTLKLSKPKT